MSFRRVGWLAAAGLATLLWISCGQVYRPVVIPVSTTPPNPSGFHAVFSISNDAPSQGAALQVDVSGDSSIGEANMGVNPTHAAILPNNSRVFVASAGTLFTGNADVITGFTPAFDSTAATGLGALTVFSLPNFGPVDPNTGKPSFVCSYLPDFVTTTQQTAVYVANYGVDGDPNCAPSNINSTDSVALLSPLLGTISNLAYLPSGAHPVALVQTPDTLNLYVLNQGNNTVVNLSPTDLSTLATIAMPSGSSKPVWADSRVDSKRVYVVTQGDGSLLTIRTDTDAIMSSQSVGGPGANFVLYDKTRNRLFITNPGAGAIYVFDATTDPPTPLGSALGVVNIPPPPPCSVAGTSCSPVVPVSITVLADGSRFYVASYVTATTTSATGSSCPDKNVTVFPCMIPQLTVFDARSLTVKPIPSSLSLLAPSLSLLAQPQFAATQYALAPSAPCAPPAAYAPGTTRFRMFTTASADSNRVYVSICDAGAIADITATTTTLATGATNTPDTLVGDLPTPFSAGPPRSNGQPSTQAPIFLLTGQ